MKQSTTVYALILTTDHKCLLDLCDPTLKSKCCLPSIEVKSPNSIMLTVRQLLQNNYRLSFPKFLGSFAEGNARILVFRLEERLEFKSKLQPISLLHTVSRHLSKEQGDLIWRAYEEIVLRGFTLPSRQIDIWPFGHDAEDAHYLASLVVSGRKYATSSLLWSYEFDEEPLPQVGVISIIRDNRGDAIAVIETTKVETIPFNEVSEQFAIAEGEGDSSLDHWRKVHWDFFADECDAMGLEPEETMPIVCETFKLLHKVVHW